MAPRTFWKGYLKLSLVTCPVTMEPARTAGETLRFHTVNRETGNRVESRYVDAVSGEPLAEEDQAKGYEIQEDKYVVLEDEELEGVGLESTRTIDIERFVPREEVGWIWLDRPHLLKPGDKVGEEAFTVIREAMAASGTAALSRLVLYRREHAVAVAPRGRGMVLWTLRYGDEVRRAEDYFDNDFKAEAKLTRLVTEVIEARTEGWSEGFLEDTVQERMKAIVAGKKPRRGKAAEPEGAEATGGNVVSIMEALKRSVAAGKRKGKDG
jgi:DNA end-binding protein Ku